MSNPLGTTDVPHGLSSLPSISYPIEPYCDHSLPNGDYSVREISTYSPPARLMKASAQPFMGIQERGLEMENPILDPYAEFKIPDVLVRTYTSHPIPLIPGPLPDPNSAFRGNLMA